jgi:hypothetical protein
LELAVSVLLDAAGVVRQEPEAGEFREGDLSTKCFPSTTANNPQKVGMKTKLIAAAIFCAMASPTAVAQSADLLPSWNQSKAKQSITDFVGKVTKAGSPDSVPPAERIATFDNDGTLWAEQPMYFQLLFALDRVKALAPQP